MTAATNLTLQSLVPIADEHLDQLRRLSGATSLVEIDATACRLIAAPLEQREAVAHYCAAHALDHAYLPPLRLADFGLLAMDMDSTLITIECIDEIADFCGLKAEVSAITEAAMRGEIGDFRESLRRRVALLAGLDASVLEQVYDARVRLSPGAETMLAGVRDAGLATLLVSGGFTFFTRRLKARLGIEEAHANTLEIVGGKLTGRVLGEIVDGEVKARHVLTACKALGIDGRQAIAMGDGSNDLPMMRVAGLSVAFRAKPVVRAGASVAFDHVGLDGLLRLF
ncbi:phosphoserine phosphatase SerB [Robbsia sp. Bb-Pol-6]|uniref:Phosphoserine phosphatase n=1 Tax=Robbsia betulipollinis TaxID=2981849 RepID=A0ABT3ZNC9_9BURK|nr:phosphoserine phosphatase SerB [Robbsia betulipollinis]MCY0388058.1 phosphoserine phosphatase SerB [Robbsia betulipollinis]